MTIPPPIAPRRVALVLGRFIIDADQARPDHPWPMVRYPALNRYATEHHRLVHGARDRHVYARIDSGPP